MKKIKTNEIKFIFDAISENEALARAFVSSFAARLDPTLEELADIRCAVSEAVTNCIVHAYKGIKPGKFYITTRSYDDKSIEIEVKDRGIGIPDVECAMQPLFTTGADEERSGMGFSIMQSFTDKLKVRSAPGSGTRVIMTKKLGRREKE